MKIENTNVEKATEGTSAKREPLSLRRETLKALNIRTGIRGGGCPAVDSCGWRSCFSTRQ